MDEQTRPGDEPTGEATAGDADETFTWTGEPGTTETGSAGGGKGAATDVLETLRDALDDLAVRAAPTVREISARAAELTATAAVKAAPLVKRAGEVTADASQKLAEKSRAWAADLRTNTDDTPADATDGSPRETPSDLAAEEPFAAGDVDSAPPFESTAESTSAEPAFEPSDASADERESDPPVV